MKLQMEGKMDKKLLSVAKGNIPADLVLLNGKIVNVYSGEIYDGDCGIFAKKYSRFKTN